MRTKNYALPTLLPLSTYLGGETKSCFPSNRPREMLLTNPSLDLWTQSETTVSRTTHWNNNIMQWNTPVVFYASRQTSGR